MSASPGERFIDTLRKMKYPNVDKLDKASFEWMFEKPELLPIFKAICDGIGDDNFLTYDELAEYEAYESDKSINKDLLKRALLLMDERALEDDVKEELSDLGADIMQAGKQIQRLELQKDRLNTHHLELIQAKEELEKQQLEQQKEIEKYRDVLLPEAIKKLVSSVSSTIDLVLEYHELLKADARDSPDGACKTFFQVDIVTYLESEENLLDFINNYINERFKQLLTKNDTTLSDELAEMFGTKLTSEELQNKQAVEAFYLQKCAVISETDYIKAFLEGARSKSKIQFLKDLIANGDLNAYKKPAFHLQAKLKHAEEGLKKLKNEEEALLAELPTVLGTHAQMQYDRTAVLSSKEKLGRYKLYLQVLDAPLNVLYEQRARLEFLQVSFSFEESNLKDINQRVEGLLKKLKSEEEEFQKRLVMYNDLKNKEPKDTKAVEGGSTLFMLNDVLDKSKPELLYLTTDDVLTNVKDCALEKDQLCNQSENILQEQLQWIKTAENNLSLFEKQLSSENNADADHPACMLEVLKSDLNNLEKRISAFEKALYSKMNDYQKKKKILAQNINLSKARKLYIYALTNQEKLTRYIKEIKEQIQSHEDVKQKFGTFCC